MGMSQHAKPMRVETPQPRLLSRKEAATYVGLSPNAFDRCVAAGEFPPPIRLTSVSRVLWDRTAIDRVINRWSGIKGAPFDDVEARRAEAAARRQGGQDQEALDAADREARKAAWHKKRLKEEKATGGKKPWHVLR